MSFRSLFFSLLAIALLAGSANAQTFTREQYPIPYPGRMFAQGDLNRDGYPDFIVNADSGFGVKLSDGAGGYQALQSYSVSPANERATFALEDFNRDGNEDVIGGSMFYAGHSDGTLAPGVKVIFTPDELSAIGAADFNHDGKLDLVYTTSAPASSDPESVGVIYKAFLSLGNGDGTFATATQVFSGFSQDPYSDQVLIGDFDGDGKADVIFAVTSVERGGGVSGFAAKLFGNGAGGFASITENLPGSYFFTVADENADGRSDLIAVSGGNGYDDSVPRGIEIWRGTSSRTFTKTLIPESGWSAREAVAADFNGDGRNDIAAIGGSVLMIFTQSPTGTYSNPPQFTYFADADSLQDLLVGDYSLDRKPDLAISMYHGFDGVLNIMKNTTSGNFPTCQAPIRFGINLCSPADSSTSPVRFNIAANSFSPLRKLEIWVDGAKKAETFNSWSTYSFADKSLDLATGTHNVSIYAATYDNRLQKKSFTVDVGTGSACAQPSTSTAVVICAPTSGSTVTAPVHVSAAGGSSVTFMEVWVDGSKLFQNSGNHVSTDLPLGNGSHTMKVYGRNGSVIGQASVTFTVGSGGSTCAQPASSTGTVICSPANGSTVSSPVTIQARGGANVTFMEAWVDGTKRAQGSGNSIFTSLSLAAGSHRLSVYSKDGTGVLSNAVSNFTVH
jgi:hypothetical protein